MYEPANWCGRFIRFPKMANSETTPEGLILEVFWEYECLTLIVLTLNWDMSTYCSVRLPTTGMVDFGQETTFRQLVCLREAENASGISDGPSWSLGLRLPAVRLNSRTSCQRPAVAQVTKQGFCFVLTEPPETFVAH
jgi:hypothetical protein